MLTDRRRWITTAFASLAAVATRNARSQSKGRVAEAEDLAGQIGITTSSLDAHVSWQDVPGKIRLVDVPQFLRDELDMKVIDLNTRTLGSLELPHVDRFRAAVNRAGSIVTNLKLNQRELDLGSRDAEVRRRTMVEYRKSVDAAARLGARWVRPFPSVEKPVMQDLVAGYRELAAYAQPRQIGLLVENYRWMDSEPEAANRLVQAVDRGLATSPDIGNWSSDEVRYRGLKQMFPLAVTCDFKARSLGPRLQHPAYDLRRCFQVGWDCGFRGPWCLEHANRDRSQLVRELGQLRDMLRGWIEEQA